MARDTTAGVTMIEMLVAISIFALIGVAGFSVLDTIVRTDRQVEGRLAVLANTDLALRLFELDVNRAIDYDFQEKNNILYLSVAGGSVTYQSTSNGLERVIQRTGQSPIPQRLLPPPQFLRWEIADITGQWQPAKPDARGNSVALILGAENGLRKLARLPERFLSEP